MSVGEFHAKRMWLPYLTSRRPVLIVYTEPQFFRLGEHVFVRHQDVNEPDADLLKQEAGWINHPNPKPSSHFVSSGETDAVIMLTRWFEKLGIETQHVPSQHYPSQSILDKNLILIGNKRTFPEIAELQEQESFNYRIENHHVSDRTGGKVRDFADVFSGNLPVKGVFSRFFQESTGSCVTMLASNHGGFFEAAVRSLTGDREMDLLWKMLWKKRQIALTAEPPEKFELIGEARVTPREQPNRSQVMKWILDSDKENAAADPL